ncbi:dTDP-4-dehydrorhamnose reductase [Lysobacter sp. HA35]
MRSSGRLELWGGVECTVNRVGDRYIEQLERNEHWKRLDDLDRFAALGIRAIRYPVLWEQVAPFGLDSADWSRPDERLSRLRELDVQPIVGLVHHGSGPIDTSLVDPLFPEKLATYARAVAERFPWVEHWTPVNEPLTTARFSGLYGLWYPHGSDEKTFRECLFNEVRGVILAMRAIESVNPNAKLVQTDDLGKTYSTPLLDYQAYFNNELRWLGWDLLCGRVNESHYLWEWLTTRCGATPEEVLWFRDNARAPDIIGVNHYITSERFLDDNADAYPEHHQGGNGVHRYADVEAARVLASPTGGIRPLIEECWERFGLPIAVTEAHIDARREDQLRWLAEIWRGCEECIDEGIDVRAVTVWGMLGLYDWNCLLTDVRDYYESGAFDVRGGTPRPTAVAHLMRDLSSGGVPPHPVLAGKGWWHRPERYFAKPVRVRGLEFPKRPDTGANRAPILITGATGTLGRAFARICKERDIACRVLGRDEMDIAEPDSIERAIDAFAPWAIINAAGYVRVDDAEHDAERCFRENTVGPANLAAACARHHLSLVTFSSDLVFDGERDSPYVETDSTRPLNVYGESKARAEQLVLDRHPDALVVRTSSFFGPWDRHNFITIALDTLGRGDAFTAADDMTVSPTYVPDLVHACVDLLIDGESGIWHLANEGEITWADLALRAATLAGVDTQRLEVSSDHVDRLPARRPRYSALTTRRAFPLPSLDDALGRYVRDRAMH